MPSLQTFWCLLVSGMKSHEGEIKCSSFVVNQLNYISVRPLSAFRKALKDATQVNLVFVGTLKMERHFTPK